MALKKKITLTNGVEVNYYRVASFSKFGNKISADVLYYVSEEYREKEIEFDATVQKFEENNNRLSLLYAVPEEVRTAEQTEEIAELEKWNNDYEKIVSGGNFNVVSGTFEVEINDGDYSIKKIYELLKETDVFKDALDA